MKKSLLVMSLLTIVINLKAGDWYLKSSGAVTLLSSWGTNPDGTGASPGSFSGANVWHFANRTGVTLTGNFSPPNTATASIENGFNLVVQTTFGQLNEKIDIPGNGTLTIANNKVYILRILSRNNSNRFKIKHLIMNNWVLLSLVSSIFLIFGTVLLIGKILNLYFSLKPYLKLSSF